MGEIRMHGRGGQGTVMAAEMLAGAFVHSGKYASVFPSFGIERRGSAVTAFARFGDEEIREKTRVYRPEFLVVLEPSLLLKKEVFDGFVPEGVVVASDRDMERILASEAGPGRVGLVDGVKIALEETGANITNVIMLGAFAKTTGLVDLEHVRAAVERAFSGGLLEKNLTALRRGYEETRVTELEVPERREQGKALFEIRKTRCAPPPPTGFEAAWSRCDDRVEVIKTGEWRFKKPVLDWDGCRRCGWCAVYCPTYERVDVPEQEQVDRFLAPVAQRRRTSFADGGNLHMAVSISGQLFANYRYQALNAMDAAKGIYREVEEEFRAVFGRGYGGMVEEYRADDADILFLTAGSVAGTIKTVIDRAREKGVKVGLARIKVFRPYPREEIARILDGKRVVATMDRSICLGWNCGHLHMEARAVTPDMSRPPRMIDFIDGLSSLDITVDHIEKALAIALAASDGEPVEETNWLVWE